MGRKFKSIGGASNFRPWKFWTEDEYVEGVFVEEKEDKFGNPSFVIELAATNIDMEGVSGGAQSVEDLIGKRFTLNSAGSLTKKMEEVPEGKYIRVTYEGMVLLDKGKFKGKDCHNINLEVADDEDDDVRDAVDEIEDAYGEL